MSKCILFNNKKRCLPGAYSVIGKCRISPEISGGVIQLILNHLKKRKQGNSENRPTNVPAGFYYFDTSLNKPVWKKNDDTNEWVDATGSSV